jgi:hypothetical protein
VNTTPVSKAVSNPAVWSPVVSNKSSFPLGILLLAALAVLSLVFVWRGAGRMLGMGTHTASAVEFVQLKPQDETRIVIEVDSAEQGRIHGKMLDRQDDTHYRRTAKPVVVNWGGETKIVMGKIEDIRSGAIVHVAGKVAADRSVQAAQIVILTGYVQVK